jgi:hypothetical protein
VIFTAKARASVEHNFVFHDISIWHAAGKNASMHRWIF